MMVFSRACEYGIRASIYIAVQSHNNYRVSLKQIAHEIDSPEAFTAKILQQLVRNNLIESIKGPSGGFQINKDNMKTIKLRSIVETIDGNQLLTECGLGMKECSSEHPCPVHYKFKKIRDELTKMLDNTSIYDLMSSYNDGFTFLKKEKELY
jgi:Rrf2 family protein